MIMESDSSDPERVLTFLLSKEYWLLSAVSDYKSFAIFLNETNLGFYL